MSLELDLAEQPTKYVLIDLNIYHSLADMLKALVETI